MKADFTIHGGWGNHIEWTDDNQFNKLNDKSKIDCWGHLPVMPKVGQTLMGEFENSFIKFKFIEVRQQNDPRDMFFAKVVPIEQKMKGT